MPQFAGALGQSGEHRVSMGNRLIARKVQSTGQVLRGLDGFFFHGEDFSMLATFVLRSANSHQICSVFLYLLYFLYVIYLPCILYSWPVFQEARPVPRTEM